MDNDALVSIVQALTNAPPKARRFSNEKLMKFAAVMGFKTPNVGIERLP